jgi:hypothetical protein
MVNLIDGDVARVFGRNHERSGIQSAVAALLLPGCDVQWGFAAV